MDGGIALAMSGSFAGSQSLDNRRRRRLATNDANTTPITDENGKGEGQPLPAQIPSESFPLRRIISRSFWKLNAVFALTLGLGAGILALGHAPENRSAAYGPGFELLLANHADTLSRAFIGGLIFLSAQLAWMICWARSRSLQDFRGQFRLWRRVSLALGLVGLAVLVDAASVISATIQWGTKWPVLLGSMDLYAYLPLLAGWLLLAPGLLRETRACRSSKGLFIFASLTMLAGVAMTVAPALGGKILASLSPMATPALVADGLWLASSAALFGGFLFHARHVIYESVEPPASKPAKAKPITESKAKTKPAKATTKAATRESKKAAVAQSVEQPAATVTKSSETKAPTPVATPPVEKAPVEKAPVVEARPAKQAPPPEPEPPAASREDRWADIGTVEVDGQVIRLDGPEDPLKGLSKRERRKLRKAVKDRQRANSYDDDDDDDRY